jgi:hypothetical protein
VKKKNFSARMAEEVSLGGKLSVNRLAFGAMRRLVIASKGGWNRSAPNQRRDL